MMTGEKLSFVAITTFSIRQKLPATLLRYQVLQGFEERVEGDGHVVSPVLNLVGTAQGLPKNCAHPKIIHRQNQVLPVSPLKQGVSESL